MSHPLRAPPLRRPLHAVTAAAECALLSKSPTALLINCNIGLCCNFLLLRWLCTPAVLQAQGSTLCSVLTCSDATPGDLGLAELQSCTVWFCKASLPSLHFRRCAVSRIADCADACVNISAVAYLVYKLLLQSTLCVAYLLKVLNVEQAEAPVIIFKRNELMSLSV